jgi:hypothetical protein
MTSQASHYRAQALAAEEAADAATLDNVRDRCLRSAAAWHEMAARIELTDRLRAERTASVVMAQPVKVDG